MPKVITKALVQEDLFGGPPTRVATIEVAPAPPPERKPRRKVHDSQAQSHQAIVPKQPGAMAQCLWEIGGNWRLGRTRQEIADRRGLKLQTVCGCVDRLLKQAKVFEPVIGHDDQQRPIHYMRNGGKVLVEVLYQSADWLEFGRACVRERERVA